MHFSTKLILTLLITIPAIIAADYNGPCSGGGGACINVNSVSCDTKTVAGKCPGAANIKCCVADTIYGFLVNTVFSYHRICTCNHSDTYCTRWFTPK